MVGASGRLGFAAAVLIAVLTIGNCVNAQSQNAMVLYMRISVDGSEARLPLGTFEPLPGSFNVTVYWGDSIVEDFDIPLYDAGRGTYHVNHFYVNAGEYMIAVDRRGPGDATAVGFPEPVWLPDFGWNYGQSNAGWNWNPSVQLINMTTFGDLGTVSLRGCFARAPSITVPSNIPRLVTVLSGAFYLSSAFNAPINTWNVSNVQYMDAVFEGATSFNQPLHSWDTRSVISMSSMFRSASSFNQPLDMWRTDSLTSLSYIFAGATVFNQPLGSWNVSRVTNMDYAFSNTNFNQDLSNWDVRRVTSFAASFYSNTAFNTPLDSWQPLSATTMSYMFSFSSYNQPLGSWNVSTVSDFSNMFRSNTVFNQDLSNWDMRSARTILNMFYSCSAFNQPLGSWNTASITDMGGVFGSTSYNQPLGSWNVASVTTFSQMFIFNTVFNQPLNDWNVASGQNFASMFFRSSSFNQPLNRWNTSSATNMISMFQNATAFNQPLTSWCVSNITARPANFANGSSLPALEEPIWGTCPILAPPEAPPVAAPVAAALTGCASPRPAGNVSCIDGRWAIYENPSVLTSGNSSVVTIQPNTTIVITDPVVAENVTIVIAVTGTTLSSAGTIQVSNCITLDGAVVIQLSNGTSVANNDRVPIIVSTRPDCFNVNVTTTVETENAGPCAPTVTGTPSVDSQSTSASLVVLFSVDNSNSADLACSNSGPSATNAEPPLPVALIGGVIGGAVALCLIIAAMVYIVKQRRFARETVIDPCTSTGVLFVPRNSIRSLQSQMPAADAPQRPSLLSGDWRKVP